MTQSSSARTASAALLAAVIVACATAPPDAPVSPGPRARPDAPVSPSDRVRALAPVERVEVRVAESFPPQYFVGIVSREANSCVSFDSLDVRRDGSTVHVQVWNLKALEMALKRRCPDFGLLHHSDQGCTYASEDDQDLLDARGIVCSMSRRGNCYDNAVMESFFSTVKNELADRPERHIRTLVRSGCEHD